MLSAGGPKRSFLRSGLLDGEQLKLPGDAVGGGAFWGIRRACPPFPRKMVLGFRFRWLRKWSQMGSCLPFLEGRGGWKKGAKWDRRE